MRGRYRHYVTVQKRTNARDPVTEELYPEDREEAWEDFILDLPGELTMVGGVGGGGERIRGVQMEAGENSLFRTTYRDDITSQMRLLYNARILNVVRVFDRWEKRREIFIGCKEIIQ